MIRKSLTGIFAMKISTDMERWLNEESNESGESKSTIVRQLIAKEMRRKELVEVDKIPGF